MKKKKILSIVSSWLDATILQCSLAQTTQSCQVKGTVSSKTALTSDASSQFKGPHVTHSSDQQTENSGVPVSPSGSVICRITHRTQWGVCSPSQFYYIKDRNAERHRARSERVPKQSSVSCCWELWCVTLFAHPHGHQPGSLPEPWCPRFLQKFLSMCEIAHVIELSFHPLSTPAQKLRLIAPGSTL